MAAVAIITVGLSSALIKDRTAILSCKSFGTAIVNGQEVQEQFYKFSKNELIVTSTYNKPLQSLGYPKEVSYSFVVDNSKMENESYLLDVANGKQSFKLKISLKDQNYSINWLGDVSSNATYKCLD
ncbi:hypothetical protein I3271_09195 [Photobacterium leiognathi]|uniref:hypothetical protein n=1 Tax=Photobacterium leiognathi TaxID=553611 RepID=UPI001EDFAA4D|nr:hypothetical protein [Photobacterium leiognathi]MCG3884864.1 hypothetical protein [Photobacterium leiognathi]